MTVHSFDDLGLDSNWWPESLAWHSGEDPLASGRVKLALIENHDELLKHRHVFAALGDPSEAQRLITTPGFKGHDPDSNGPHPSAGIGEYDPRFWVFTDGTVDFEPLAVRWRAGGKEVVIPDQGLLMTYGLIPRYTDDQIVHWDDLEEPTHDCVFADTATSNSFNEPGTAFVDADAALIQDYSSLRGLSVVHVFYVETAGQPDDQVAALLGDERQTDVELLGRTVSLKRIRDGRVLTQCWGIRLVIEPGDMPLTEGRWDYGEHNWPGAGIVSKDGARMGGIGDHVSEVFVRDTVLARFEGQPDMDIHPDSGAVSYKNQWGVGWCQRYGRDLIRVDLKKLYEGNRPEIVRHYHEHAVEPPPLEDRSWGDPNVATRAERIAFALANLGEVVDALASTLGLPEGAPSLVPVTRADLEYRGWWSDNEFELIARHIPPGLSRDDFVDRCGAIHRSTVGRLGEVQLRAIVHALGFDPATVRDLRSLKLLELIMKAAVVASESGLNLIDDRQAIVVRVAEGSEATDISVLFKLNDIRQLDSHAHGNPVTRLDVVLRELGIDPTSTVGGYDRALDLTYDLVGGSLEALRGTLSVALAM